jgi:hypothetical protein
MSDYQPVHNDHPVWYNGVQVNTLTFANSGAGVMITGIAGWQDGIDVRDAREPRPGHHGEDADNAYMGGRTITIMGIVAAASWSALQTAKQALAVTLAPTSGEVLLKVPIATASAPATSYAAESMANYERSSVKVIEGLIFGDVEGFTQSWQVVLRASDQRIYSDTITTDDENITSYAGAVDTPAKLAVSIQGSGATYMSVASAATPAVHIARATVPTAWDAAAASFTTKMDLVVDAGTRDAYFAMPHYTSRTLVYDAVWYYRLNEAAGVTADNAEGTAAYDGTINGTPLLNQTGPATDMKSIYFDGVNDSVSRAWAAALFPAEWTMELWLKNAQPGGGYALDYTTGTTKGVRIYDGGSYVLVEVGNGTALMAISNVGKTNNAWAHVAVTYREGLVCVYLNGVLFGALPLTFSEPTAGTYYIGRSNAGAFYTGNISGVGVYPVAHNAQTIDDMYNDAAAQAICRYQAGENLGAVQSWPVVSTSLADFRYSGNASGLVSTYRAARL